jgi:tetratricopeptide (TPR) repeat protein
MKRATGVLLAVLLVFALAGCWQPSAVSSAAAPTYQEQYDLGVKYLSEGNYQEAVAAFAAAIAIEAKHPESYIGLADAYTGLGDAEHAQKALEDGLAAVGDNAELQSRLEALSEESSPTDSALLENDQDAKVVDKSGNVVRRNYFNPDGTLSRYQILSYDKAGKAVRSDNYDGSGTLTGYTLYTDSEDGLRSYSENFSPAGESLSKDVRVLDADGRWLYSGYVDENGKDVPTSVAQYDKTECIGWNNYRDGTLTGYARYENGKTVYYDADGNVQMYMK